MRIVPYAATEGRVEDRLAESATENVGDELWASLARHHGRPGEAEWRKIRSWTDLRLAALSHHLGRPLAGACILDLGCGFPVSDELRSSVDAACRGTLQADASTAGRIARLVALGALDAVGHDASGGGRHRRVFEPWLCRALHLLGALPVGVDVGPLDGEPFECFRADLAVEGSLSCLAGRSFDAAHSSLLFSSLQLRAMHGEGADQRTHNRLLAELDRLLADDVPFLVYAADLPASTFGDDSSRRSPGLGSA